MKRIRTAAIPAACFFLLAITSSAHAQGNAAVAPAQKCADLVNLIVPGTDVQITKAESVPVTPAGTLSQPSISPRPIPVAIPAYCKIDGVIDSRTGAEGKPYAIGFEMALPDKWNGRFMFQGGGGLNGYILLPLAPQAAGDDPALARGFAVVTTDTGHKGAVFDASFMKDQLAALDFAYIAIGRVTVLSKEIIAQYYGQPAKHSYYDGCSTGGREAMMMTQRYPMYFDGVISGDPAMRTGNSNLSLAHARASFTSIAPKDAAGKPDPVKDFSDGDKKLLADSIMKSCDEKDGLKDGMILNPEACSYDPAVLQCKGAKTDSCLSSAQVGALRTAFSESRDSHGREVYPRFPWESGFLQGQGGPFASFLPNAGPNILAGVEQPTNVDIDTLVARVRTDETQTLTDTTWTNLSSFFGHGGKLIFYHGTADPIFSPFDTLEYYKKMADANGGLDLVMSSSRFFFVPGMNHCAGGPAALDDFDMVGAIVDWVENGKAPDAVNSTGRPFPGRSRPLCAYPKHAQYKGSGNPEDAASFECVK